MKCSHCEEDRVSRCSYADCPFEVEQADAQIATLSARVARLEEALQAMLREHDILSGNYGDIMDPKHKRPDRWPTAAEARRALEGGE